MKTRYTRFESVDSVGFVPDFCCIPWAFCLAPACHQRSFQPPPASLSPSWLPRPHRYCL